MKLNKMSIIEFINYTKAHPLSFINYCEAIINPNGAIIMCNTSHIYTAIECAAICSNKTVQQIKDEIPKTCDPLHWCIDKYGLIAVWYCGYLYSIHKHGPNRFQKRSIELLIKNDLIQETSHEVNEYEMYLKRKAMGLDW